jgi:hypothetical protein
MTKHDFSDYHGEAIPKIIAQLQMKLRYGDGEDNVLRKTKDGSGEGLDVELTLLDTEHARRKFFAFMLVVGETEGQKSMAKSNRERLKQIIDSGLYLDPYDKSPETRARRSFAWRDFDGFRFLAEIGVEESKNGFPEKNVINKVITKDNPLWGGRPPINQAAPGYGAAPTPPAPSAPAPSAPAPTAAPIVKPGWAS